MQIKLLLKVYALFGISCYLRDFSSIFSSSIFLTNIDAYIHYRGDCHCRSV